MGRRPQLIGLTLCERIDVDRQTRKPALVGLFQSRHFSEFPSALAFTAYASLYDGIGEGTIELEMEQRARERRVYRYRRWIVLPGRQRYANLEIPVRRCVFPAPGRYRLRLLFDGELLAERDLDIYQEAKEQ